jgi:hypothetical protein
MKKIDSADDSDRNALSNDFRPRLQVLDGGDPGEMAAEKDEVIVKDHFAIKKAGDLWLLNTLSKHEVVVNDIPTLESLLEGGELIVSGGVRYRFAPTAARDLAGGVKRFSIPWLESILLLSVVLCFILWRREPEPEIKNVIIPPPDFSYVLQPRALPENEDDALIQARLRLNQCEFFVREYRSNDSYLHSTIVELRDLQRQPGWIKMPPDLKQKVEFTLQLAETKLQDELRRLKNNAIIARAAGRSEDYIWTLNKLARMANDPNNPTYRWAVTRIQAFGS